MKIHASRRTNKLKRMKMWNATRCLSVSHETAGVQRVSRISNQLWKGIKSLNEPDLIEDDI